MSIEQILNRISNEPYMKNMRQDIVDAIEQVYADASFDGDMSMEVMRARGGESSLDNRLDKADLFDVETITQLAQIELEFNTRVSEIIANAGDGTLPTEFVDMRTVNGETYTVVGDAMRSLNSVYIDQPVNNYYPTYDSNIQQTANQLYSNNDILEKGIIKGITMKVVSTTTDQAYFDLNVIIPNVRHVSSTRINFTPLTIGVEEITITGLAIDIPSGAVVATRTPLNTTSALGFYPVSSLGNIQTYNNDFLPESLVEGKMVNVLDFMKWTRIEEALNNTNTTVDEIENSIVSIVNNNKVSPLKSKKWSVVGDSISDDTGYASIKHYYEWIQDSVDCTVFMQGKSATGFIQAYPDLNYENIMDRVTLLDSTSDYITIFAGTNDINRPLGSMGSTDVTNVYGAIDNICKALIEKFPSKKIAFFTPIPRVGYQGKDNALYNIVVAIKEVCGFHSIPVLDLYTESGLRPNDATFRVTYFDNGDGLHPNSLGHEWITPSILSFMEKL